jgi:hypothetical protein
MHCSDASPPRNHKKPNHRLAPQPPLAELPSSPTKDSTLLRHLVVSPWPKLLRRPTKNPDRHKVSPLLANN